MVRLWSSGGLPMYRLGSPDMDPMPAPQQTEIGASLEFLDSYVSASVLVACQFCCAPISRPLSAT